MNKKQTPVCGVCGKTMTEKITFSTNDAAIEIYLKARKLKKNETMRVFSCSSCKVITTEKE